jgi:hypothetical protein
LDENIIKEFPLKARDMFKVWYKPKKSFKSRPSGEYPTNLLRTLYQYDVAMLCKLYGEPDTSKFPLTWEPLIYYIVDVRSTFNWDDILSVSLEEAIRAIKETIHGQFPSFHMSSYLLDMVCVCHEISKDGLGLEANQNSNPHLLQGALGAQVQNGISQDL